MKAAINISKEGIDNNASSKNKGGPIGAVLVKDGKIIGKGKSMGASAENWDPTSHAEVMAIRDAAKHLYEQSKQTGQKWKPHILEGSDLYTSLYPCPMCYASASWAGIKRIFYVNSFKDTKGFFEDEEMYKDLQKSPEKRKLPCIRMNQLKEIALKPLQKWIERNPKYIQDSEKPINLVA